MTEDVSAEQRRKENRSSCAQLVLQTAFSLSLLTMASVSQSFPGWTLG